MFFSNVKLLGVVLVYGTIFITFLYGIYLFNIWQIKLDDQDKAMKERQRRIDAVKVKRAARKLERERLEKEMDEVKDKINDSSSNK